MQLPSAITRARAVASIALFAVGAASLSACDARFDDIVIAGSLKAPGLAEEYAADALIEIPGGILFLDKPGRVPVNNVTWARHEDDPMTADTVTSCGSHVSGLTTSGISQI